MELTLSVMLVWVLSDPVMVLSYVRFCLKVLKWTLLFHFFDGFSQFCVKAIWNCVNFCLFSCIITHFYNQHVVHNGTNCSLLVLPRHFHWINVRTLILLIPKLELYCFFNHSLVESLVFLQLMSWYMTHVHLRFTKKFVLWSGGLMSMNISQCEHSH